MHLTHLSPSELWILLVTVVVGAAVGSFLTLITYRLPRDMKVGLTRSQCTQCKATLAIRDLLPILSWLLGRGRCRQCRAPIHPRYVLTELACAAGAVAALFVYGPTWEAFAIAGLWWCIVAIIVTDLEHYIILDEVQIACALFGVLYAWCVNMPWHVPALSAAIGVAVGLALKYGFIWICNKDGLGLGDVKFLGVAGIWLGDATNFVPFFFFSGVLGILSGLLWRRISGNERFPFGPALALALLLCVSVPSAPEYFWRLYGVVP